MQLSKSTLIAEYYTKHTFVDSKKSIEKVWMTTTRTGTLYFREK